MHTNPTDLTWRTSSFSDGLQCVAVADLGDGRVAMRSSKDRDHFTGPEWAAFIQGVKAGEFDDLAV